MSKIKSEVEHVIWNHWQRMIYERWNYMSQIQVNNLTFYYDGGEDVIFKNASFSIDTNWKLGLLGRNGKGKTTLFKLLMDQLEYSGVISKSIRFDYFPYQIKEEDLLKDVIDFCEVYKPGYELWRLICELDHLSMKEEVLYRPFCTLSHGERTKVMLALLFSSDNEFLLIDEPTNHLDQESRDIMKTYLEKKRGYILVSHDRDLLDACIDHVLVLNRYTIEVQSGNFSSWWENKNRKDAFLLAENEKHSKEIAVLKKAAERTRNWADKNEQTKIGFDAIKEHDRNISTRAYIGAKTKKMQSRVKQMEKRIDREILEKENLLVDIETPIELKMFPQQYFKEVLVQARNYGISYKNQNKQVFEDFNFTLHQGERVFLHGKNGCGKSSFLKAILKSNNIEQESISNNMIESGLLTVASGLKISYVNQDTTHLKGSIVKFCEDRDLQDSLFFAVLRQMGLERSQFYKTMETYSEGQKKKILLAASLVTPAHLYLWDEPLNYIDLFSRIQVENLILKSKPSMIVVEHDSQFRDNVATRIVEM